MQEICQNIYSEIMRPSGEKRLATVSDRLQIPLRRTDGVKNMNRFYQKQMMTLLCTDYFAGDFWPGSGIIQLRDIMAEYVS